MEVHLGIPHPAAQTGRPLIHFLYELHQRFDLDANSTETILHPRDELTLFKFILRESQTTLDTELHQVWIELSRSRILLCSIQDQWKPLIPQIEDQLRQWNLVDRTKIVQRLVSEFENNLELKAKIFDAAYVIDSPQLDWFEYAILEMLVGNRCPHLCFTFANNRESALFNFRLCSPTASIQYKKCLITDAILSYVGLAVNLKDSMRLLRLLNRPKRGLDRDAFVTLTRLAKQSNLSAAQMAMSFACRRQLASTAADPTAHSIQQTLQPWANGLYHLVESIQQCQDALAGVLDDSVLVSSAADDRMNWNDAAECVRSCIQTACRMLHKPLRGAKPCTDDAEYDECFVEARMKQVKDVLFDRVKQLTDSAITELTCDTPGRSLLHGGSLRGRGAIKLARLLLVEQCVIDRSYRTAPELRTPDCTPTRLRVTTPITDGKCGDKLVIMFPSPGTPKSTPSTFIHKESLSEKVESDPLPPIFEEESLSMPERPVFARYQSNLDWADTERSPLLVRKRTSFPNFEGDTRSVPDYPATQNGTDATITPESTSCVTTPTKSRKILAGSRRTLFDKDEITSENNVRIPSDDQHSINVSVKSTKPLKKPVAKKARKCKPLVDHKQRNLTDFFSAH